MKYMAGVPGMSRVVLFLVLAFFKRYPKAGTFDDIVPKGVRLGDRRARQLVRLGVDHLYENMREIS